MGAFRVSGWILFSIVGVIACGQTSDLGEEEDAGGATCGLTACGGELVGSWQAETACTRANLIANAEAMLIQPDCRGAVRSATLSASGVAQFSTDGSTTSTVAVRVDWSLWASNSCLAALTSQSGLVASSAECTRLGQEVMPKLPGTPFASGTCSYVEGGCDCQAVSYYMAKSPGSFAIQGTEFVDQLSQRYPYCVDGNALTFEAPNPVGGAGYVITFTRR